MQIPPITELQEAAKRVVWAAKKKGTLMELTPRLVRHTIETQLDLDDGSLDASKYKSAIKSATAAAVNQDPPPSEDEDKQKSPAKVNKKRKSSIKHDEDDQPTPTPKGKSRPIASRDKEDEGSMKKKRKTAKTKKMESEDEEEENYDNEEASPRTTKKKRTKRKDTKQFKSLEHVPTSDMEQDEPGVVHIAGPSIIKPVSPKEKARPSLQTKPEPSSSKKAQNPLSKPTDNQRSEVPDVVMGGTVGRDLSSELTEPTTSDEPEPEPEPKPKVKAVKKEPKTTKTQKKEKEKKSTKSSTTLNADEETIKRLKSLVTACGVRKIWARVFQDLDSPSQQIKKLREILAELGMTGRLSMDHAKMIKRKRELAQELADVQQFEKTFLSKSSRTRSQGSGKAAVVEEDDDKQTGSDDADEDEDEAGPAPKRRPSDARKSINAFLQDQSDEE